MQMIPARLLRQSALWLAILFLAACTTRSGDGEAMLRKTSLDTTGLPDDCFFVRDVSDFEPLTTSNLIVYAPYSKPYLLTFAPPKQSLSWVNNIGFLGYGPGRRICGYAGEKILLADGRDYAVMDVRRLDAATLKQLLADKAAWDEARLAEVQAVAEEEEEQGSVPAE